MPKPIEPISEWTEDDWENLLRYDPLRPSDEAEYDYDEEYDYRHDIYYTTEDFAEEFFNGTDSPEWEALFP
jgi:hypothetical protein